MKRAKILKKLNSYGLTKFERKVLLATLSIKKGYTLTYKDIASKIGNPNSCRAVGTALKNNPLPIIVPCHRVVRSDGSLGNYNSGGTERKRMLLMEEGALI